MSLPDTIHRAFRTASGPAMRLTDLNERVRAFGAACTPTALRRQIEDDPDGLRTVGSGDAVLREVIDGCPDAHRPIGADEVVVDGRVRGIRPTPADGVRVLARRLDAGQRSDRARWMRLLHALNHR